ncbi:MAG: MFS transporter [Alphaproteobacteria bacterium]|nr:MAG: MFS transporter [Alphaproteobacteria bacterium]
MPVAGEGTRKEGGWRVYLQPAVLSFLAFGFASGLPLGLIGETWRIRLAEEGIGMGLVGLTTLTGTAYALKFLWAPLLDRLKPPPPFSGWGRRRGWMATLVTVILCALVPFAHAHGSALFGVAVVLAVVIAVASASFDIVVDAYRIERLAPRALGAGTAVHSAAWYVGARLVGGIVILLLAESLGWPAAYLIAGGSLAILLPVLWLSPEPAATASATPAPAGFLRRIIDAVLDPLRDLWRRFGRAIIVIFLFVVFFKLQDAMAGALSGPFVRVIGYEKDTIAWVYKGFGLAATFAGMFLAGAFAARRSLVVPLWLAVFAQILSNFGFSWLAVLAELRQLPVLDGGPGSRALLAAVLVDADWPALAAVIGFENLASGFGNTLFVVYLSRLVARRYTAGQYALLSALALTARSYLAAPAGFLADGLGWPLFFVISGLAGLPGAVVLWLLIHRLPASFHLGDDHR